MNKGARWVRKRAAARAKATALLPCDGDQHTDWPFACCATRSVGELDRLEDDALRRFALERIVEDGVDRCSLGERAA